LSLKAGAAGRAQNQKTIAESSEEHRTLKRLETEGGGVGEKKGHKALEGGGWVGSRYVDRRKRKMTGGSKELNKKTQENLRKT